MALGATQSSLAWMVLRQGLRLGFSGMALAVPAVWALGRFLRGLLHGVSPADPGILVVASVLFTGVVALAAYLPAQRAAGVDPARALRSE